MRNLVLCTFAVLTLSTAPFPALAKGGTPQNHHCMKDGAEVPGKTHKQCVKDGGKWEKLPGETGASDTAKGQPAKGGADQPAPKAEAK